MSEPRSKTFEYHIISDVEFHAGPYIGNIVEYRDSFQRRILCCNLLEFYIVTNDKTYIRYDIRKVKYKNIFQGRIQFNIIEYRNSLQRRIQSKNLLENLFDFCLVSDVET